MSEQINSVGIEDVLSSVRRLVSEELRPSRPQGRAAKAKTTLPALAKLILTPALRVVNPVVPSDGATRAARDPASAVMLVNSAIADPAGAEAVAAVLSGGKGVPAISTVIDAVVVAAPVVVVENLPQVVPASDLVPLVTAGAQAIDTAALRDLVRDVIRTEFQGQLGENITRNMRKLVRAEVNRMLASHGLG